MSQMENVLDFAAAGLSLIPLKTDGSKAPAIGSWKSFERKAANEFQLETWFSLLHQNAGVGLICGAVSGGVEVLDFDHDADTIYPAWSEMVDNILCRLPVVETPSFGRHVFYRCNRICRNKKIAQQPSETTGKVDCLIESRGQGGYVVSILSPANVHARNYPYVQVAGPVLPEIPRITPEERRTLWEAAATFDRSGIRNQAIKKLIRQTKPRPQKQSDGKLTPWEDYNHRGDWYELLQRHDWSSSDCIHWRHPAAKSNNGHSATLREASTGDQVLHVFTTSTMLDAEKSHSLYSVFAALDHAGDFSAAAKALRSLGYGK